MATRKKGRTKKAVQPRTRAKGGPRRAPSGPQRARAQIHEKVDAKLRAITKLARELEKQGLAPDEIVARVRSELTGIGPDMVNDVLKLVGGGIWVQTSGEA